jgi:uncharacterized protein (TIGR03000 family)
MLENTGVFDVNSCTGPKGGEDKGQQAILVKGGGVFTKVFVARALEYRTGKVSWKKDFYPVLQRETSRAFKRLKEDPKVDLGIFAGQEDQVPERFPHGEVAMRGSSPAAPRGAAPATVTVSLPADATLTFNGDATRSTSSPRLFHTPPLQPGKTYVYTVRARVIRQGLPRTVTRKVTVQAGRNTHLRIPEPASAAVAGR